jgi:hypothetical protein
MENNQVQEISKNSQTQLTKQNSTLINFVRNKEEYSVINSFDNKPKISELPKATSTLIDTLAKWRWMAGVGMNNQDEDQVAQELALITKFIVNNYEFLTLEEIDNCIDLSLTDKLNIDVRTFNVFSPMYVSRVLNAYLDYKRKIYNDVYERKEINEQQLLMNKPVSNEFKRDSMVDLIKYFYEEYKSKGTINDLFNSVYNFLRRTKRLMHPKELVDEAMEYGKVKCTEEVNMVFGLRVESREKVNKDAIQKRYARNYIVEKFFKDIDIDELILGIELTEFE